MEQENIQLPENNSCFKSSFVETGFHPNIKVLEDNPEKIIRFNNLIHDSIKTEIEKYSTSKELFYELRDNYDIAVPDIETLINVNDKDGKKSVIIVTDRIHGKNLDKITVEKNDETIIEKYEKFFDNMIQYYIDKYEQEKLYLSDIKSEQFVYGKRKGDKEAEIYFADVGKFFSKYSSKDTQFFPTLKLLIDMLWTAEKKINESRLKKDQDIETSQMNSNPFFVLTKARKKLFSFIEQIPSERKTRSKDKILFMIQELSASKKDLMLKFSDSPT